MFCREVHLVPQLWRLVSSGVLETNLVFFSPVIMITCNNRISQYSHSQDKYSCCYSLSAWNYSLHIYISPLFCLVFYSTKSSNYVWRTIITLFSIKEPLKFVIAKIPFTKVTSENNKWGQSQDQLLKNIFSISFLITYLST